MIEFPNELDVPAFHEAWAAWETHRREKKQKLTPTSISRQLASLKAVGVANAILAIERSIEKGWTGLFPEDSPKGKSGSYQGLKGFAARAAEDGSMHKEFGE